MKRILPIILLTALAAGAFHGFGPAAGPAGLPAGLRDAPNSGALAELEGQGSGGLPAVSAPAPKVSASKNVDTKAAQGDGKWTGWLKARSDFDYLPGTQNESSGTPGFGVYYRCSKFFPKSSGQFMMDMQFGNDKGGDLGIVTWTSGPSADKLRTVRFEGSAELFSQSGRPYTSKDPSQVLNNIKNYNGMCAAAYKTVEAQRPIIVKYLLRKDIKSMQRMYKVLKFAPGPMGMFAESMEIALDAGTGSPVFAGVGAGCLAAGVVVEKATHGIVRESWIRYMLEKQCSMAATAATTAYESSHEEEEEAVYFAGRYKDNRMSTHYYVEKQPNGQWVTKSEPMGVALNLAYVEKEEQIKNVFFDHWR